MSINLTLYSSCKAYCLRSTPRENTIKSVVFRRTFFFFFFIHRSVVCGHHASRPIIRSCYFISLLYAPVAKTICFLIHDPVPGGRFCSTQALAQPRTQFVNNNNSTGLAAVAASNRTDRCSRPRPPAGIPFDWNSSKTSLSPYSWTAAAAWCLSRTTDYAAMKKTYNVVKIKPAARKRLFLRTVPRAICVFPIL